MRNGIKAGYFDNNDNIKEEIKMKRYPHTESTDLIVYNQKPKKEKKPKIWLTAVTSALAASIFTAAVFGTVTYHTINNMAKNTPQTASNSSVVQQELSIRRPFSHKNITTRSPADIIIQATRRRTVRLLNRAAVRELYSRRTVILLQISTL